MALPVVIPNTFASATASIPLSQLDSNFNTLSNVINEINAGTQQLSNANVATLIVTGNATIGDASTDTVTLNSTLTANTAVIFTAGTSAAPSITTTGDTNTGIFFPAADTIAFAEGGAEAMRIDSSGNVGIGTNSPSGKLHISGGVTQDGGEQNLVLQSSNAGTIPHTISGSSSAAVLQVFAGAMQTGSRRGGQIDFAGGGASSDAGTLIFRTGAATGGTSQPERLRITSTGNVGIGTSSPARLLTVSNTSTTPVLSILASTTGVCQLAFGDADDDNTGRIEYDNSVNAMTFGTNDGIERMRIDSAGNVGIGTSSPAFKLHTADAGTNYLAIDDTANDTRVLLGTASGAVAFYARGIASSSTAKNILFATGATERARITSGGNFQTSSGNSVMVGGTAARATTAGTNRVDIFDGTAPVGTLANGVSFYSASGEANVMDAAGNATLLSPHDAETNEWIFRSKHTPTGKVLKIDVERLLKFVNDHFGLDAVHEFIED